MNKIWFFGDSFCAWNENWVSDLAQKCNCEIAHLGVPGSSLTFVLHDILNHRDKISSQDRVVILFTGIYRDYYNGMHFMTSQYAGSLTSTLGVEVSNTQTNEIKQGYEKFRFLFFNTKEYKIRACTTVSHIINSIIPTLQTDKIVYHYSLNNQEIRKLISPYVISRKYEPKSFMEFGENFCKKYIPDKDPVRIMLSQDLTYRGKNHWVNHPKFEEEWWETFDPLFKNLY